MSFSFGASSSSTPGLFGGASAAAFGGASTPSLFGSSTPAFGAPSTPSLFGGSFGTPSSTPSLFGGSSQPAFGSTTQSAGALNFGSTTGSLFGGATPAFGQPQGGFGFGQQSGASFASAIPQQQAAPQSGVLATVDNKQLTHYTKWEEINPNGQAQLLELERVVSQTKEECRQLEECPRLQNGHQEDPGTSESALKHTLQGFVSSWRSDEEALVALNERVHGLLHDTETAIRAFQRSYRWREAAKASQGQVLPPALRELLSGPVVLPSHFLRKSVHEFQTNVAQYQAMVAELERLLPRLGPGRAWSKQADEADSFLRTLPAALSNNHDLLYQTAARIDALHMRVSQAKEQYLEDKRQAGDSRDPFRDAERREQQREQAARSKVTVIPPAGVQHTANGGSQPGQAAPPQPNLFAAGASAATPGSEQFGGTAGGQPSLFGQQAAFGQVPQQRSSTGMRKGKSKK